MLRFEASLTGDRGFLHPQVWSIRGVDKFSNGRAQRIRNCKFGLSKVRGVIEGGWRNGRCSCDGGDEVGRFMSQECNVGIQTKPNYPNKVPSATSSTQSTPQLFPSKHLVCPMAWMKKKNKHNFQRPRCARPVPFLFPFLRSRPCAYPGGEK
ncbi:hypothetical protein IQ07DRAFT_382174 [Pyrenochaeta sp. DS3sAY3a]|nr:hypothetical protein IQ07DRAFT_382174 [Pyrenochaeta sp. DS3sAY3a]